MKTNLVQRVVPVVLITGLAACSAGSIGPAGDPAGGPEGALSGLDRPLVPLEPTQAELTLGNREYVASMLKEVFTPTGEEPDIDDVLGQEIRGSLGLFGGACSIYTSRGMSDCSMQQKMQMSTNDISAPMRQSSSAAREARRIRACERVIDRPGSMAAAISKIPAASYDVAPNPAQVAAAFDLFYLGQELDDTTKGALSGLVSSASAPGVAWQMLFLALCTSPGWQVP